jgi:hypothetical protein
MKWENEHGFVAELEKCCKKPTKHNLEKVADMAVQEEKQARTGSTALVHDLALSYNVGVCLSSATRTSVRCWSDRCGRANQRSASMCCMLCPPCCACPQRRMDRTVNSVRHALPHTLAVSAV